ncbi:MAG: SMC-Scp complex subunit ScpB [Planctomycetes bacterium]|nr:SMC-Scp complex subunit ScpB [Planctomycetota bacterium]
MIQRNADDPVPDESASAGSGETVAESPVEAPGAGGPDDRGVRAAAPTSDDELGEVTSADGADDGEAESMGRLDVEHEAESAESDAGTEAGCDAADGDELPPPTSAEGAADGSDAPACDRPLGQRLEAVLFASGQPLAPAKLARVLGVPVDEVRAALDALVAAWQAREGAIDLVAIAGGYRFMTRPAFQADLQGLAKKGKTERLSPAALETLSIVAYKQPITRADVEAVRGVAAGPLLRVLLDRDLIRVSGRSPEPGHPLLYGTTKRFLDHFGLESLRQLPDIRDLLDVS